MPKQVYVYPRMERQLESLAQQAKPACISAARARRIMDALALGEAPASAGLLKRKTDKRVKNCLKFDLGSGFRLICISDENVIYVLFVGDHDSADNWLDINRKKRPHKTELKMHEHLVETPCARIPGTQVSMKDPFETLCFPRITQKDLRRVFKGLVG